MNKSRITADKIEVMLESAMILLFLKERREGLG